MRGRNAPATLALTLATLAWQVPAESPAAGQVPADWPDSTALSLQAAIAQAKARNETVAIAAARLDRARAISRQAYATLVPGITLTGTYTRRQREVTRLVNGEELTIQARDGLQAVALAEATLFDARAFPLVRSARRAEEAQALESGELVRGLEFEVAQAFFAVLSTERLVEAARRRIEVAEDTVSDADIRRDAGLAALNDVTRTRLEEATARLTLTEAETAVRNTRYLLSFLIGESGALGAELTEPPGSQAPPATSRR
jgi:outer membrane protein TolC